jgi:superfamily II DNA helicase RecQ
MLPNTVPWRALLAMLLPHILKTVEAKILHPTYITINSSSNRLNTTYVTHQLASHLDDPNNYKCFLTKPFDLSAQPCILIFFDNKILASKVAKHLDKQLPTKYQSTGLVCHYHSGMSDAYLQVVHTAFTEHGGQYKILCATSGESVVSVLQLSTCLSYL